MLVSPYSIVLQDYFYEQLKEYQIHSILIEEHASFKKTQIYTKPNTKF